MRKESSKSGNLSEIVENMQNLLNGIVSDLEKSIKGNKAASQRVRTGTVRLEKVAKMFRKESIISEKNITKSKSKGTSGASASRKSASSASSASSKSKASSASKSHASKGRAAPAKAPARAKSSSSASASRAKAPAQKASVKAKSFAVKRPTAKLPSRSR